MTGTPAEYREPSPAAAVCARRGNDPALLIEILHDVQAEAGRITDDDLTVIATAINRSRAEVWGAMSFYHDFRRQPAGTVVVKVCRAEACQSVGAFGLIEAICAHHGIELGGTSEAGVTIEPVYCLGNCALSPAALVNNRLIGRLDEAKLAAAIEEAAP